MSKLFSNKKRPFHLGPYPLERLSRSLNTPDLSTVPPMKGLDFSASKGTEASLISAIRPYQAMLDATRDGLVKREVADIPEDLNERSRHLKSFGYYCDASQMAICALPTSAHLAEPIKNPGVAALARDLESKQVNSLSAGVDVIMAELKESMRAAPKSCRHHRFAIVFLYEYPRDPKSDEAGCDWIQNIQAHRACVRSAETAVVIANYIRLLGYDARAHTGAASELDLNQLAVSAGLAEILNGQLSNPYLGPHFGLAAVSTELELSPDAALLPKHQRTWLNQWQSHGPHWHFWGHQDKKSGNHRPFEKRQFRHGPHPFEQLKQVDAPTTFIDEPRIPRVPKRTDMFARAQFGDMGPRVQDAARNGNFMRKSATAFAPRRTLGAFMLLQSNAPDAPPHHSCQDPERNADRIKATSYFLGIDAVGIGPCPDWAYYSHNSAGQSIEPYHRHAISIIIDQGQETMEGASGDDWIACSQSMRAYLRFSFLGGIIAEQIRLLGYEAKVHTSMDSEVLHPPLLLLSGLGEVSRIGEVILNPFLGPRLKSGIVTTNMPLAHDKPIDFGLQNFCNHCQKCARECPSGAITAGPKVMFNGYEIWKSDSQKCTTYRITTEGGAMCGRCMKTCPWNLEGLFAEKPFRWAAMQWPEAAKHLAKLDDWLGNGGINPVKKWWWDLEMVDEGPYRPSQKPLNERPLQRALKLKYEDQTLAVYPAHLAPPPWSYPYPMEREAGIQAYKALYSPIDYKKQLQEDPGKLTPSLTHHHPSESPVLQVRIADVEVHNELIHSYTLVPVGEETLPKASAGAHIDVMITADCFRQYSLASDPEQDHHYTISVQKEANGRGGSVLLHRLFELGRKITISRPINHFPLDERASKSYLMGGGIGITPMVAMAHRLYHLKADFELHYSCSRHSLAAYAEKLKTVPWAEKVFFHFSDRGERADFSRIFSNYQNGETMYTCGPDRYMGAVLDAAELAGFPEHDRHFEYFSAPTQEHAENTAFVLRLAKSKKDITVPADQSAAEALQAQGYHVPIKCSDGICGVCQCGVISGDVEHRDFVLSNAQRQNTLILCQSRAAIENGVVEIDL